MPVQVDGQQPFVRIPAHQREALAQAELVISNYAVDPGKQIELLTLRPYEARVYRLTR